MPGRDFQPASWRGPTATPSRNTPRPISAHERGRYRPGPVAPGRRPVQRTAPWFCSGVCRRLAISSFAASAPSINQRVADFDEEIAASDPEFAVSGLKAASLIRLGFLAVLPDSALLGRIGSLSDRKSTRLNS